MLIRQYTQGHGIQSKNMINIRENLGIKKRKTRIILQKGKKRRMNFVFAWKITGIYRDWMVSGVTFFMIIA